MEYIIFALILFIFSLVPCDKKKEKACCDIFFSCGTFERKEDKSDNPDFYQAVSLKTLKEEMIHVDR